MAAEGWHPDVLGPGFTALTMPLPPDDEGPVAATLVRYRPTAPALHGSPTLAGNDVEPLGVVLYLHGWNNYFFHTELAEFWHRLGYAFYAVDLRKYGRSLREWQSPGFIADLADYDLDLAAAREAITHDLGSQYPLTLMAHSTGALIACLWAHRHPGQARALILSSPWLELQGSALMRTLTMPVIETVAKFDSARALPNIDPGFYARTLHRDFGGEWDYDLHWQPSPQFPIRAGWLGAIMSGHAEVAHGLSIAEPILVLCSAHSLISPIWHERMRSADIVLDVASIARRALNLGPEVTVSRIDQAVHDLLLSAPPVRAEVYRRIERWCRGYLPLADRPVQASAAQNEADGN